MNPDRSFPRVMIVMGVCGCGKTSFATMLSEKTGSSFIEGDRLHPPKNIEKMSRGEALDDEDRQPWLEAIVSAANQHLVTAPSVVIACSALKHSYRDILRKIQSPSGFIHLAGDRQVIVERMAQRKDHFMPISLLDSQLATLETTRHEPDVVELNLEYSLESNLQQFLRSGFNPASQEN